MPKRFEGVVGRTFDDSTPWWPPLPSAPPDSPNIVIVLLDDVGYAQFGCYGSDIETPTFDRLAGSGLRYSNYHTTALCSPTRAALLTGRNHHSSGMGRVAELASGFPGYDAHIPKENGFLSEMLLDIHYATFACGKWHLAPAPEMTMGGARTNWPLSRGFERYYGFLGGETDQYHPELVYDNHQVHAPRTPEEGYHITEDLVDHAIMFIKDLRAASPTRPFFLYLTPGACHAPHQAPASYITAYRGRFDQGWDTWREQVYERQLQSGLLPQGTVLSPRPSWVQPWDTLSDDEHRLFTRMMEVFAGFLTHTDAQVGRLLDFVESLHELDNTLVLIMSDNGASAEGGPRGSFNEQYFFNLVPESLEENLRRIDDLGTSRANNHYPWGWAWAGNTPLKRFKRDTHEGGVADPLIVHWPARIGAPGTTRHQYVHSIDIVPTVLELLDLEAPTHIGGVEQNQIEGVSFASTLEDADAPSLHVTQYYEMLGSRAIYHDGWKAVTYHTAPLAVYDDTDVRKPFDEDVWELYHVAEDLSETHDLADAEPAKLKELQDLWWSEAERYQVLPLNNLPGKFNDRRHVRERYVYHDGIGSIHQAAAPRLRNRLYHIGAELNVPEYGDVEGMITGLGNHAGGWALYLNGRRLHYAYNFLGTDITTVSASIDLPPGRVTARMSFTPTGDGAGDVALFYGDVPVAEGHVARSSFMYAGSFGVGHQPGSAITDACPGVFRMTPGVLELVVFEIHGRPDRNPVAEARAAIATQ